MFGCGCDLEPQGARTAGPHPAPILLTTPKWSPAPALDINLQYLPSGSCPWYLRWGAVGRLLLGQHVLPYMSLGWTCWARSADIFECLALSWPDRRHCFPLKLSQSRGGGEGGRQWERRGEHRIPFMTECGVGQDRAFGTHARTSLGTLLFLHIRHLTSASISNFFEPRFLRL